VNRLLFTLLLLVASGAAIAQALNPVQLPSPEDLTSSSPVPVAAPAPVVPTAAADPIDMTPFQEAFDKEIAEAQAEATGANANLPADAQGEGSEIFDLALRSLAALLAICGTIILLGWAAKRWGGKTPLLAGTGLAQVLGRVYLEPKVSLHFVKTGGRVIVVGVTSGTASLITEFEAEQFEQSLGLPARPEPAPVPPASARDAGFLARLREQQERAAAGVSASSPPPSDDLDSLRGDIQRLKQFLQESRRGADL